MSEYDRDHLQALLPQVCELARQAGEQILGIYNDTFTVERKKDDTPLTEADMAAHNTIVSGLRALTPALPVLSEESASIPFEERRSWARYWLVDPLDGTREFIKHNGEFTVNIALIKGQDAELGVIYVPISGVCYLAIEGFGAFRQTLGGGAEHAGSPPMVPIHTRTYTHGCATVACSRSHRADALQQFLDKLGEYETINMGSALKSCLVAEGRADLYPRLGPTSEWDTAAAQCIVEQAGGQITDTRMQRLRYNTKDCLLNPHFFVFGASTVDWSHFL